MQSSQIARKFRLIADYNTILINVFRYSEICKDIGLASFSSLDLQQEIDTLATTSLGQLGLKCGQISLSNLIVKSGRVPECDNEKLIFCFDPVQNRPEHFFESSVPSFSEDSEAWKEFVNLDSIALPEGDGFNSHVGSA